MKQLTEMQQLFMELAASFIHNEQAEDIALPENMRELMEFAAIHKMSAPVFEMLRISLPEASGQSCWSVWKKKAIQDVLIQQHRTEAFLEVYQHLQAQGVTALVVKGIVCRSMYALSDYRISGDEDLLVRAEDARACDRILRQQGYIGEEPDFENLPQETGYRNPQTGVYLEVHFSLFDKEQAAFSGLNMLFQDAFERAVVLPVQGKKVWTLAPTEHMLYLLLHCGKHFLFSGFGVRQVCDIVRMAEHWEKEIDWDEVTKKLLQVHMLAFARGLFRIGRDYLHMPEAVYERLCPKEEKAQTECEDLLLDILDAGIYGSSSADRLHSANVTLAAAEKKNVLRQALFPGAAYLQKKYPFAKKYPVLLPAAWAARIVSYVFKRGSHGTGTLEKGMERAALIRKYGLME